MAMDKANDPLGATVIPRVVSLPQVSSFPWNPCPVWLGMGVQFPVESLSSFPWNTQSDKVELEPMRKLTM